MNNAIILVTNFLRTRSLKEVNQLFEQRFRDRASPTKITIWKNVKKYKTEGSGHRRTKRTPKRLILFKKILSAKRIVWTLVRVHLTKSLSAI